MEQGLIYIGNGAWRPNVPARDLTAAEVELYGGESDLLSSGLYKRPEPNDQQAPAEEVATEQPAPTTRWKKDKEK